ncbi:MAG: AAA family ATPase [Clostridiales bacterium]|nr:AAA family ATPase [Clostridiales bacterium]
MIYKSEVGKPYFVDKTKRLKELIPLVEQGNNHICITRPRRFGKSVMAAMIGAFFGKGFDSSSVFDGLEIASDPKYKENLNKHELVYIDFSGAANLSKSYDEFISKIESKLIRDLHKAFPHVEFWEDETVADCFRTVNIETETRFIFVFDEWDCIFHKKYLTKENRESFINFLVALTKGRAFVSLTYMTGVLPIAKYLSGSTINHFDEYNMANNDTFSEYFGFTDKEVDRLYEIYLSRNDTPTISREDLAYWYDGYHIGDSRHIYNPRSVVFALSRNKIGSYWTNTGPYS